MRKRVLTNQPVGEHERKPSVIAQRFEAVLQAKVRHRGVRLVEPAHRLVDETKEIGYPKRRRRIDAQSFRRVTLARAVAARYGNGVFQDQCLSFLLLNGSAADQYPDHFLEVEKPERQLEIVDVDYLGGLSEGPTVFVVRVDEDDVRHRGFGQNGRQEQAHSAGFTGAGGAKHSEMLAQ